jgi:sugar lactone lactonase YvrE
MNARLLLHILATGAFALLGWSTSGQSIYTPHTFTNLAGSWPGSADGTGSAAQFRNPYGLTIDHDGNGYVADSSNHTIRKVTPGGTVTTLAGLASSYGSSDGTGTNARFWLPASVAVDGFGNVFVADSNNSTIRKVTTTGVVTTFAGRAGGFGSNDGTGAAARFYSPEGIAIDQDDNLYVSDTYNYTIRKITPAAVVTTLAGAPGQIFPLGADGTGSAARFYFPAGIATDTNGNVYVADTQNNTIRKIAPGGVVTTIAGNPRFYGTADGPGPDARFYMPNGLAADAAGNVYVADTYNYTIRRVTPTGMVTTLAGDPSSGFTADGTGRFATFRSPAGVAVDIQGTLYVIESGYGRFIRGHPQNTPAVILSAAPDFGFNSGQFGFRMTAPRGQTVVVEASTDLANWLPLSTNMFLSNSLGFTDSDTAIFPQRFYRARTP